MKSWQHVFNFLMWGLGIGLIVSTIDGWVQAIVLVAGGIISCIRMNPDKSRLDLATEKIVEFTGVIYHSAMSISREWVPLNDSETTAKAVILAEMKDSMTERIWNAHAREEMSK